MNPFRDLFVVILAAIVAPIAAQPSVVLSGKQITESALVEELAPPPAGMVPSSQMIVLPMALHPPAVLDADRKRSPTGKVSVTTTPSESEGPLLSTATKNSTWAPRTAVDGLAEAETERSAVAAATG